MKWLKRIGVVLLLLIAGLALTVWISHEPRPIGVEGLEADTLAHDIEKAVGLRAWKETEVVSWTQDNKRRHLWDKGRGLVRVRIGDTEWLLRTRDFTGRVWVDGAEITDPEKRDALLFKGQRWFVNDSFWLFPFQGLFDAGVTRSIVKVDGERALMITYASGGVTPGDAYVWLVDEGARPKAWKVWVKVLPAGGLRFSWENWEKQSSGALIATDHHMKYLLKVTMRDLKSGADVSKVEPGPDPFIPLY